VTVPQNMQPTTEAALSRIEEKLLQEQNDGKPIKALTGNQRHEWSEDIAAVLADPACPLEPFLQSLSPLPGNVTALAAVSAWTAMSEDRRTNFLRWLDTLSSDRSASLKVVLIPKLLSVSPATTAELLLKVSLANKELKTRLASSLLVDSASEIDKLFAPEMPAYKARKVLICILQLCEAPKLSAEHRWGTLRVVITAMMIGKLHEDGLKDSVLEPIGVLLQSFPPLLQQKAKSYLTDNAPQLLPRFFPEPKETPHVPVVPTVVEEIVSDVPSEPDKELPLPRPGLVQKVTDWLAFLRNGLTILDELVKHVANLETKQSQLDKDLQAAHLKAEKASSEATTTADLLARAHEQNDRLKQNLGTANEAASRTQEHVADLEARLNASIQQESELRKELLAQQEESTKERSVLYQRVQMNADRRLDEFRNALGSSLTRLLQGLPKRGVALTDEDSEVVLVRLYEMIDILGNKGVAIKVGQGDIR
jgi:hypothetical protein